MPPIDLTPDSANTIESLIVISCELFILQMEKAKKEGIQAHLEAAEELAGQILEHYGSLAKAAEALSVHSLRDDRLPFDVLQTLLYASVREHPKLGMFLDELYSLYSSRRIDSDTPIFDGLLQGAMSMNEMSVIPSLMTDSRFAEIPSPSLLDAGGNLQYQPAALSLIQGAAAMYQISRQFNGGVRGISMLLSQYPAMDEDSRKWMDGELAKRVYHSVLGDNHPVRKLLRDKLDVVDEARVRIRKMFDGVEIRTVPNYNERKGFMHYLGKAFELLERMPLDKVELAFVELNIVMREWTGQNSSRLTNSFEPVKCLVALMERAKTLGYDPVERLIPIIGHPVDRVGVLQYLLRKVNLDVDSTHQKDILLKAILLSTEDAEFLGLDLDEAKLAKLADVKDSQMLRQALLKTNKGRDAIFGQDLGL